MKKRFKIYLQRQQFYCVELDAENEENAIVDSIAHITEAPDYYKITEVNHVVQVLINDRHERDFAPYVPD